MGKVYYEELEDGESFFGGSMGMLTPLEKPAKRLSGTNSQVNSEFDSALPQMIEQIAKEAREQMVYQPEPTEPLPSSTTTPEKDSTD